jgi:2-oxoglutarate dehydrogenase complex dehydrogenase (E1) component-like enzyme
LSQPSDPAGARFHGPNFAYVLEIYEGYRADPASVDEGTRGFFERWSPPGHGAEDEGLPAAALDKALKAARLVEGIRSFGYAAARLDPLGSAAPLDPVLEADFHGLNEEDLEGLPAGLVVNGTLGESVPFVRDAGTSCVVSTAVLPGTTSRTCETRRSGSGSGTPSSRGARVAGWGPRKP